jgi:hypothetical protein
MPNQRNLQWYRYVSDGGVNFGIQADKEWGDAAASGLTAFNSTDPAFGPQSTQHRTRKAVYRDPQTFRSVIHPVGTATAFAALPATLAVTIVGSATTVTYNLARRISEKMRVPGPSRPLADHT